MKLHISAFYCWVAFCSVSFALQLSAKSLKEQLVIAGLRRPVKFVEDGDRAYIVEQPGRISLLEKERIKKGPALDIIDRVYSGGNETGLLGLAFHPQVDTNGRVFVNYTTKINGRLQTRVSEFRREQDGRIDARSEQIILDFDQPYENHNGGELEFGPDGYLYIGTGDGGSANDPLGNGQKLSTLLGKILRIDVDRRIGKNLYTIPKDNPFYDKANAKAEIYAYGLRNPWRFSFDPQSKRLWVADVGQNLVEEIDIIHKGGNYGWNIVEGDRCFLSKTCEKADLQHPIHTYGRELGQSITGGFVYRGRKHPDLIGKYIYGDYLSGRIWALAYDEKSGKVINQLLIKSKRHPSAFAETSTGDIIIVDHLGGALYRLQ